MNDQPDAPYVDPETALILKEMVAADQPERFCLTVEEARLQMEAGSIGWNSPLPDMAEIRDLVIEGPLGDVPLRLFRPKETASDGVLVYFHGGGWVLGSLKTHNRLMRLLAIESGMAVLGVDYRRSPEHPFPGPLNDCLAAIRWTKKDGAALGIDPKNLLLGGDSAGANLALGCLLDMRNQRESLPLGAGLFYGCYWAKLGTPSHERFGQGDYRLSTREMGWFWRQYLGDRGKGNPLAEPMDASLAGLPPLYLNYGTVDPLADDTTELVKRLDQAGVMHECVAYPGLVHGFLQMTNRVEPAALALREAGQAMRGMID